jgi:hypothetical protein
MGQVLFWGIQPFVAEQGTFYVRQEDLRIYDVSNPTAPEQRGRIGLGFREARGVVVRDDYAYIAGGDSGFHVVDVHDVQRPFVLASLPTQGSAWDVVVRDSYAYVAAVGAVRIIDIGDPSVPHEVGLFATPGPATDLALAGNHLYVALEWEGMGIWDLTDPIQPQQTSHFRHEAQYTTKGIDVHNSHAFMAGDYSLLVVNVADPAQPLLRSTYGRQGWDIAVDGLHAFLAGWQVEVLDISSLLWIKQVGQLPAATGGYARYVSTEDGWLLSSSWAGLDDGPLSVYDISNAPDVRKLAEWDIAKTGYRSTKVGDYIYAGTDGGLTILRLDELSPQAYLPIVVNQ